MRSIYFYLLLMAGSNLFAQSVRIHIFDLEDGLPIKGISYTYGDQEAYTDEDGLIKVEVEPEKTMYLSHLTYGKWEWSTAELQALALKGSYFLQRIQTDLYPVTVIALRPSQQPSTKRTFDYQDQLEHDGARILQTLPGISAIQKAGNYGYDPVFRGFKYDQLNIVLNGVQGATAACPNRMDPPTSQMTPNMLERVEVLKGPHALRYGTGLGATINFVPSPLHFSSEADTYGRFSTGYALNGEVWRNEGQLGVSGAKYDWSVQGAWSQGNDYTTGEGETVAADFQRGSVGSQLGFRLGSQQELRLTTAYNFTRDADFAALPMDLRTDDTWMLQANHKWQPKDRVLQVWHTALFGSFVDHLMDNLLKPLDPRMLNAETAAKTMNYGARTEGQWRSLNSTIFVGADWRVEQAEGTRLRSFLLGPNAGKTVADNAWQEGQIQKGALFGEYRLSNQPWQYTLSGRLEWNEASVTDVAPEYIAVYPETNQQQLNPSISLGARRAWANGLQFGLWVARAQRSGSLTERYINYFPVGQDPYELLGNPQLDPEVNYQADLKLEWANELTNLRLDVFIAHLQDYISSIIDTSLVARLPSSPGVRQFQNIGGAFKTGFEFNWVQQLLPRLDQQLGVAYTYGQDTETQDPLPEIAPLDVRYQLHANLCKDRLHPSLTLRYVMAQKRIAEAFGETVTPSFALLDLEVSYHLTPDLRLHIGVDNVFDTSYYEHLNRSVRGSQRPIYAPGLNVFGSVSMKF